MAVAASSVVFATLPGDAGAMNDGKQPLKKQQRAGSTAAESEDDEPRRTSAKLNSGGGRNPSERHRMMAYGTPFSKPDLVHYTDLCTPEEKPKKPKAKQVNVHI
jgi:hypothetical protein